MNPAPEPVPNDVAALRAMLIEVRAERDAERTEKVQLAAQNEGLSQSFSAPDLKESGALPNLFRRSYG